jgi:hypothetical protein
VLAEGGQVLADDDRIGHGLLTAAGAGKWVRRRRLNVTVDVRPP